MLYDSEVSDGYFAMVTPGEGGGWVVEGVDSIVRHNYPTIAEAKMAAIRAVDPEAPESPQVRIEIGKAYEVLQPGRREATKELAQGLRAAGLDVQLNVAEYVPGRTGLGPVELTAIFIGTGVANSVISLVVEDCYQRCKDMLRRRRTNAINSGTGRKRLGFTIFGPHGEVLRQGTTDEDEEGTDGAGG